MTDNTAIESTDATWNPVIGCTRVDEGCRNCYAEVMAARFSDPGQWGHGLATRTKAADGATKYRWTGITRFVDHALDMPLRWRKPRKIFVCSTSDLFGESVPDEWIDKVFAVMALAPHHTFQVLTKRPERARAYMTKLDSRKNVATYATLLSATGRFSHPDIDLTLWPLPNVWLGTSISDQPSADLRIPELLATPAAVRFISAEPLLGPVDLTAIKGEKYSEVCALTGYIGTGMYGEYGPKIDWVICGGESGQHARPMHPDWARSIRDQCAAAGVAFFFKEWGEWGPDTGPHPDGRDPIMEAKRIAYLDGGEWQFSSEPSKLPIHVRLDDNEWLYRLGKKQNGALLDGREHKEFPNARP